jgi:Protein of unknown function (DUF3105)
MILLLACAAEPSSEECKTCDGACLAEFIPATSAQHTPDPIVYEDAPPTSGDHNPCWADWGVYTQEVADENWVHNLEHGGIVYLYNCPDGCADEVAGLTTLTQSLDVGRALLTPYSEMTWRFAAVSWQNRLLTDCFDEAAFRAFFDAHVAQAPESSTANATGCMDTGTSE